MSLLFVALIAGWMWERDTEAETTRPTWSGRVLLWLISKSAGPWSLLMTCLNVHWSYTAGTLNFVMGSQNSFRAAVSSQATLQMGSESTSSTISRQGKYPYWLPTSRLLASPSPSQPLDM